MLDLDTLLDYIQDDCDITLYDTDNEKNIVERASISEIREWAENHYCEVQSLEPTPTVNTYDFGITINISDVESYEESEE